MKTADIDKHALNLSIRNRKTRITENQKLIEQHKLTIAKLNMTIKHEQEQLEYEEKLLGQKKGASLI